MEIIKEDVFRRQIKKGFAGGSGFLLFGDEDYLKLHALNAARTSVCADASLSFFNDIRLDTLDFTPAALLEALTPLPMMSDRKIVSVSGLNFNALKPSDIDAMCEVLGTLRELDFNVLIISVPAGGMDEGYLPKRPSALLTKLSEYLTPVRFENVTPGRLTAWCEKHFEHNGAECSDDVCRVLIERCGTSMFTLASEIDKLSFYVLANGRTKVSADDVDRVTPASIEADGFALANAVLDGKSEDALNALAVMKFNRTEPVSVLSEISRVVCDLNLVKSLLSEGNTTPEIAKALKMNEYKAKIYVSAASVKSADRLKRALVLCSAADSELKLSASGYTALEKLLCSL